MHPLIYSLASSPASSYAALYLKKKGYLFTDHPTPDITHILLDTPMRILPEESLEMLPAQAGILGGFLPDFLCRNRKSYDLLQDESYLWHNAALTAQCALSFCANKLSLSLSDANILLLGYGRIGKHLTKLLVDLGCSPTIYSGKHKNHAMLASFGIDTVDVSGLSKAAKNADLIINTIPVPTLHQDMCNASCCLIDLASEPGLVGERVIRAKGLPGKLAPESSGILIANHIDHYFREAHI